MKKTVFTMAAMLIILTPLHQHVDAAIINGNDQTNATVSIQSGDLSLSDITSVLVFNPLSVTSETASTQNNNTIEMDITDYRGTHTGWTLNAQFSDFENLSAPGVTLGGNDYINAFTKRAGMSKLEGTATPTLNATTAEIFTKADGTFPQFEIARALNEAGAGDVKLRIPTNMFELVLTDKTRAGNYTGTMTFNLVNGPAS